MTDTGRVVTFGEVMLRLKSPGFERLFQSGTLEARFGGSEANVAINLSRFGVETAFVQDKHIHIRQRIADGHSVGVDDRVPAYEVQSDCARLGRAESGHVNTVGGKMSAARCDFARRRSFACGPDETNLRKVFVPGK